ncbi:glycosyltransferase family 117 protein [Flavobacterium subsaxonicum]|uniref:Glycosyltransferase n=1 Tax=Flavobacterium subsaxonicum WB 4.1-42 = DSM 21790 TaxID=1121898 RepID=A0A0A2MRF6_9FLAO|nr:DUF2723 domain-containing protein [Flavobacterium subsaxonicum]KGO94058.1 hypothetical protein Q766_03735 [Flavobacterium subsaxonicum WB 4.1-42 = DSM 21790]
MNNLSFKKWNTLLGWTLFAIALVVYTLTVEPTLSFWDCGEYISTSAKLEVGHPPGAPLFQMAGAVVAMFATSPSKVALMVNMVSVLSSAFTILFMFWSLTLLLKSLTATFTDFTRDNATMVLGASAVGSLAFLFSDSFWFNATEAEVYAMASLFIAILLWTGLKWGEEMHTPRGNKWLLIISLLIGLSFGVHFMALLTIPSIGFIYYFKNYKTVTVKNFIIANIVMVAVLFFVFGFLLPYTLALFGKTEIFMVNSLGLPFNSGTIFVFLLIAAFFYFGLRYTQKKELPLYNTILLCLLFILIGFSTWLMLPIRANANVVINENNPANAADVLAYYNREQYPQQRTFYGPMYTEGYAGLDKDKPYTDSKPNYEANLKTGKYEIVNNYKNAEQNPDERHSGFLPRMGATDKGANYMNFVGPPKFKIDPDYDFSQDLMQSGIDLETLSDEQAGMAISQARGQLEQVIGEFKNAYARGEIGNTEYDKFLNSYKDYLLIEKPSFGQNMSFMFEYQFGYMYWRYLMWNFTGRQNDEQGRYGYQDGNWISGIGFIDDAHLGPQEHISDDMRNNKARNTYFFIPFILGVVGMIYHARKDAKSFYVLLALFLFTGIALKIFLNERPFEPRERDYALVGSFYVFALWIAFGVYALFDGLKNYLKPKIAVPVVLAATMIGAPLLMAAQNWDDHDRSGRYTALSMAKAYLDSCDPNAILFTIGDNDTFPLWYAQEVEGYRTDVRVVCTTLFAQDWYIDSMKRKAHESDPMPISFTHDQYVDGTRNYMLYVPRTEDRISVNDFMKFISTNDERAKIELNNGQKTNIYPSNKISFPVDRNAIIQNKVVSPQRYDSIVKSIDIDLPKSAIYKNALMMLDIIRNNNWKRPIYFSGGNSDDSEIAWMNNYLQQDGLVLKLVPIKTQQPKDATALDMGYIEPNDMFNKVSKWDWGNSGSPDIYVDPQSRRNSISFRMTLARLMQALIDANEPQKARKVIDMALTNMPVDNYGFYFISEPFAGGYYKVGDKAAARKLLTQLIGKYKGSLNYYASQPISMQNINARDIVRDIEQYRSLLIVMQENNDAGFYNSNKKQFNTYVQRFRQFGLEAEK